MTVLFNTTTSDLFERLRTHPLSSVVTVEPVTPTRNHGYHERDPKHYREVPIGHDPPSLRELEVMDVNSVLDGCRGDETPGHEEKSEL